MITRLLPGVEGIKKAYLLALKSDKIDVQCLSQNYEAVIGDFFEEVVAPVLEKKQVREVVKAAKPSLQTETDLMITDQAVYFVSFEEANPYAVVFEGELFVKALRNLFEMSL